MSKSVQKYKNYKWIQKSIVACKPKTHSGPPKFQLKIDPKTYKTSKFERMKQKIKGISINKNGVHYEKSNDADVGELEQVEEVVVTTKTYLSNTRVMFHIVGAKDGIDEPKLDEILYNMKRQLIQRNNSPLLQGKGMKIVFFQVL